MIYTLPANLVRGST